MIAISLHEFNSKVKKLELGNAIEKNTFNLVRDYLNGDIIEARDGYGPYSYDESFIIDNIQEISKKIKSGSYRNETKKILNDKLNQLRDNYNLFKDYDSINANNILDKKEKEFFIEYRKRVFYSIIELRAALNLDLSEFYYEEVGDYCETVVNDVINNKYKRLNLTSHLDEKGNIIRLN